MKSETVPEALTIVDLATRYVEAFRLGRLDDALALLAPDVVRVAPLESGAAFRGVQEIVAHVQSWNADVEILGVEVGAPFIREDGFAVRFSFDELHVPTQTRRTTAKMSVYTVAAGRISREEVCYFTQPHPREQAAGVRS